MTAYYLGMLARVVQPWITVSFPIIRMVLIIIEVILSVFLTIVVLFQSGSSEGMGSITGGQDTFFGKNKGNTLEGRMKRLTVITAALLVIVAVLFFITMAIYNGQ